MRVGGERQREGIDKGNNLTVSEKKEKDCIVHAE